MKCRVKTQIRNRRETEETEQTLHPHLTQFHVKEKNHYWQQLKQMQQHNTGINTENIY